MSDTKQDQFLALYEPVHERFERFCRARVYGDMDYRDLINESLLVAYDKMEALRKEEAFLSFLIGISVRILSNNHQKKKEERWSVATEKDKQDFTIGVSDPDIHFLYEGLSHLKEVQRECLILFEISGFSVREIAAIQNASESGVKQRLKRGRDKLTQILTFESSHKTGKAI